MSHLHNVAVRPDGEVREEAGWIGPPGERIFVFRHLPPEPRAALVVCSPVGGEGDSNYRREVLLARLIAHRGIAVQRHHWRGTGNSDDDAARLTFESMVHDTCRAIDSLATVTDAPTFVLGTRLSSFVAAEVTARYRCRALSLWHPPSSGGAYFRELGRLLRVNKLAQAAGRSLDSPRTFRDEVESGVSEVGGYQIHQAYYQSMIDRELGDVTLPSDTDVQLVHFGGSSIPKVAQGCLDAWAAGGSRVASAVVSQPELWWFAPDDSAEDRRPVTAEAVAVTGDWFTTLTSDLREQPL